MVSSWLGGDRRKGGGWRTGGWLCRQMDNDDGERGKAVAVQCDLFCYSLSPSPGLLWGILMSMPASVACVVPHLNSLPPSTTIASCGLWWCLPLWTSCLQASLPHVLPHHTTLPLKSKTDLVFLFQCCVIVHFKHCVLHCFLFFLLQWHCDTTVLLLAPPPCLPFSQVSTIAFCLPLPPMPARYEREKKAVFLVSVHGMAFSHATYPTCRLLRIAVWLLPYQQLTLFIYPVWEGDGLRHAVLSLCPCAACHLLHMPFYIFRKAWGNEKKKKEKKSALLTCVLPP